MRYLLLFAILLTLATVAVAITAVAIAGWGTDPMGAYLTT